MGLKMLMVIKGPDTVTISLFTVMLPLFTVTSLDDISPYFFLADAC